MRSECAFKSMLMIFIVIIKARLIALGYDNSSRTDLHVLEHVLEVLALHGVHDARASARASVAT